MPSAREIIQQARSEVSDNIKRILNQIDEYTLEGLCVYAMCSLFHATADSTAATFVDFMASCLRIHHSITSSRVKALEVSSPSGEESLSTDELPTLSEIGTKSKAKKSTTTSKDHYYIIASKLLEFLTTREVVEIEARSGKFISQSKISSSGGFKKLNLLYKMLL